MTCKALCPSQLKCVIVIVKVIRFNTTNNNIFCTVLIVHKYEESNVDFKLFLNCCKLGNCLILLSRPFHTCIPLTVIDSSLWVVFAFLT